MEWNAIDRNSRISPAAISPSVTAITAKTATVPIYVAAVRRSHSALLSVSWRRLERNDAGSMLQLCAFEVGE
jgi:hypothetical protein